MTIPGTQSTLSLRRRLLQIALFLMDAVGCNRWFRALTRHDVRVLMYHGVSDESLGADYWLMVPKSTFEWQMSHLSEAFEVSPWTCLLEHPVRKPWRSRPKVVITFDDAYSNVYRNACPTLKRFSFPAVCFVIPDLSERGEEVWTTRLFRLLLESDATRIPLEGVESADLILPSDRRQRHAAVRRFTNDLKWKSPSHIQRILDKVIRFCEPTHHPALAGEFALMSMDEILKLRDAAQFTIGTHSNSHYSLSSLGAAEQEAQIADSVACLRRNGIEPTAVFAYPSGHFDKATVTLLKKHGFKVAFTTEEGLFHPGGDPLCVNRIAIGGDMTRLEFKFQLSGAGHFVSTMLGRRR